MKTLLVAISAIALSQFVASAQNVATAAPEAKPLTEKEREFAVASMQSTRKLFLDSIANLTPEQWTFKPAPDRWSIAECAEHIALSEDFIPGVIKDRIMKSPAAPEKRAEVKVTDQDITEKVPERSQKFKAPEPIAPKKTFAQPEAAVEAFKQSRARNIEYLETTQDDLRDHFFAHPALGMMDAYQWWLLVSGHTERHTNQILEVKSDPKFPK